MVDDPPYRLDVEGVSPDAPPSGAPAAGRPWLGILFECCQVYARVYRDRSATTYVGRCPKCLRRVRLRVGPGGTDSRFFTAH